MMEDKNCKLCGHSFENNLHGFDQNDAYIDENDELIHLGRCTYCRVCSPGLDKLLKEKENVRRNSEPDKR